jgi:predicted peptidase
LRRFSTSRRTNTIFRRVLAFGTIAAACTGSNDDKLAEQQAVGLPPTTVPAGGGGFVLRTVRDGDVDYRYQVFVPRGFDASRKWPVILSLHGSGDMGSDGVRQTTSGLGSVVRSQRASFPAIVVFPQAPSLERGVGRAILKRTAIRALDQSVEEFNGDTSRVYLAGYSLGAKIGYEFASENPRRFAAFVAVSGNLCVVCITGNRNSPEDSVYLAVIRKASSLPIWILHGGDDQSVPVEDARRIVQLRQSLGSPARYSEFPHGGHAIADTAFSTPGLFEWLLAQHR